MQQTTTPFLPFHPPDFDYEKPEGWREKNPDNNYGFTSTGVLIPIIKTEWFVDGEFDGADAKIIPTQAETQEGIKEWEWYEALPFKLYENYNDAQLYLAPNQPLNWLRDGITFLNR